MLYDRGSTEITLAHAMELLCDKNGYEDVTDRLRKDIESLFEQQEEKKGVKKFGALTYYPDGIIEFPEYSNYGCKSVGQIMCTPWKSKAEEKKKDKDKINLKSLSKRNFMKNVFLDALKYVYNNKCQKKYFYYTYDLSSQTRKLKTNFKLPFADLVNGTVQNAIYGINQYSLNGLAIDNMFRQAMSYINCNYQGCVKNNLETKNGTAKILMVDDIKDIFKNVIDLIKIVEPHTRSDDDYIFEGSVPITLRKRIIEKYDIDVEDPKEGRYISRVADKMMMHNSKVIEIQVPSINDFKEMNAVVSGSTFYRKNDYVYANDDAKPIKTIKARPDGVCYYSYRTYNKVPCDTCISKCIHCSRHDSILEDELGNKVRQCDVNYNKVEKEFSIYMANVLATIHDYIKDLPDSDYKKFLYKKGFYNKDKSYLEILKKGLESMEECKDD